MDFVHQKLEEKKAEVFDSTVNRSYADEIESFRSIAGDADAESLEGFLDRIVSGAESYVSPIVLSPDSDKSHRTASFKRILPHFSSPN